MLASGVILAGGGVPVLRGFGDLGGSMGQIRGELTRCFVINITA